MADTTIKFSPVNIEKRSKLDVRAGDTIRVWYKIQERGKTRLQPFEGLVLARKHGSEPGATITVRKIASGVGVERIFPLYSPLIDKVEILKRSKTRRSKLYFIREKAAKEIRKKMRNLTSFVTKQYQEVDEPKGEEAQQTDVSAEASAKMETPQEKTPKPKEPQPEAEKEKQKEDLPAQAGEKTKTSEAGSSDQPEDD